MRRNLLLLSLAVITLTAVLWGQAELLLAPGPEGQSPSFRPPSGLPERNGPIARLYRELRSVELDPGHIVHLRDAVLDRGELHLYFTDGDLAFTRDVAGRVTGAYFQGEGEVLMRPPDLTEHASLGLFSGLGVLDEHFTAAYLRFNNDLESELRPFLRESEAPPSFAASSKAAESLAEMDALRLLESLTSAPAIAADDQFLHARVLTRLGPLDVYYDSLAEDQFTVARLSQVGNKPYLDVWMAFPAAEARRLPASRHLDPVREAAAAPVESFTVEATLMPPERLEAHAELEISVREGGQRLLIFELARSLAVDRVTLDGAEVEFLQNEALGGSEIARLGNDLLTVVLPEPLVAGEHHRLAFHYAGAVMQAAAPGLLWVGARGLWYPNRGMQMSRFYLSFRWPRDWVLVATGRRGALRQGEMQSAEWSSESAVPTAGFNLGRFASASERWHGIEVASYSVASPDVSLNLLPISDAEARNQAVAKRAVSALSQYEEWFGPYPYNSLSLTQLPGMISQGWPSLIYLSSLAYLTPAERTARGLGSFEQTLYSGFVQDHETAHQWWGDLVGWSGYRDQWMSEALASFSAWLLLEREDPANARRLLEDYRHQLLARNAAGRRLVDAGPVTLGYRLGSSVFPDAYVPVTYGRGLWLMVMLRDLFDGAAVRRGAPRTDSRFLEALGAFARRYGGRTATTDDLRRTLEEFLPPAAFYEKRRSLAWFFDEWVRGSSVPRIRLGKLSLRPTASGARAAFDLTQEECPESLVTAVPVYAENAAGRRTALGVVFADGASTHYEVAVPAGTRRLIVDPEHHLLRQD